MTTTKKLALQKHVSTLKIINRLQEVDTAQDLVTDSHQQKKYNVNIFTFQTTIKIHSIKWNLLTLTIANHTIKNLILTISHNLTVKTLIHTANRNLIINLITSHSIKTVAVPKMCMVEIAIITKTKTTIKEIKTEDISNKITQKESPK